MRGVLSRRHRAILSVLGAAAVLAGCGDAEPVRVRGATLTLRLDEYRIRPQAVAIDAGEIRIVAHNTGRLTHNVKVEQDTHTEAAVPVVYGMTPTAHPGETVTSEPFRLAPGVYRMADTIGNHDNLGQYGELRVLKPGA